MMSPLKHGQMELYTRFRPYWDLSEPHTLTVTQTVTDPGDPVPLVTTSPKPEDNTVHFRVTGPRIALPAGEVLATWPVANDVDATDDRLPYVFLKRRTLPWERLVQGAEQADPWLAVVLFPSDPADAPPSAPHRLGPVIGPVTGPIIRPIPLPFLPAPQARLVAANPSDLPGDLRNDQAAIAAASVVEAPVSLFRRVLPKRSELRHLCHVRRLPPREALGDDDDYIAVVLCNRMPEPGKKHLACLISLEGRWEADVWPDKPVPQPARLEANERFLVLHSWTFTAGQGGDFKTLIQELEDPGKGGVSRLGAEAIQNFGYVQLDHRDRDGTPGTAWYRGPASPVPVARDPGIVTSRDLAMGFAPQSGSAPAGPVISYSSAFEIGRLLTEANESMLGALQHFRGHTYASNVKQVVNKQPIYQQLVPHPADPVVDPSVVLKDPAILENIVAVSTKVAGYQSDPSGIARLRGRIPGLPAAGAPGATIAGGVVAQPAGIEAGLQEAGLAAHLDATFPNLVGLAAYAAEGGE